MRFVETWHILHNLSERQVESYVNENLRPKRFVGLAVDRLAPDHSSLTEFRAACGKGKLDAVNGLLEEIVKTALPKGSGLGAFRWWIASQCGRREHCEG